MSKLGPQKTKNNYSEPIDGPESSLFFCRSLSELRQVMRCQKKGAHFILVWIYVMKVDVAEKEHNVWLWFASLELNAINFFFFFVTDEMYEWRVKGMELTKLLS